MSDSIIPSQRFLFDIPEEMAYFNCSYMAPSLKSVRAAGELGVARKSTPWAVKAEDFFNESNRTRALFAELIGATANDIALVPSVSYGMETAAANMPVKSGQHILVLDEQFPSNYYPWLEKAKRNGAEMKTVPRPPDHDWTSRVLEAITPETAIVTLPHCHWTDGTMIGLEAVGERCQAMGIPLILDATQSLGAMPLDLKRVKPAFMVAASYKWLLGPYSLAMMYVDPAYHLGTPLENNWITRKESENFSGLVNYTSDLVQSAVRFDVGERSNFALLPMAIAALDQLLAWSVPSIQASLSALTAKIESRAVALGFQVPPKERRGGHMLGIRMDGPLPADLANQLAEQNIFVSVRGNAIRISPHLYNNDGDINRLFGTLEWLLKRS